MLSCFILVKKLYTQPSEGQHPKGRSRGSVKVVRSRSPASTKPSYLKFVLSVDSQYNSSLTNNSILANKIKNENKSNIHPLIIKIFQIDASKYMYQADIKMTSEDNNRYLIILFFIFFILGKIVIKKISNNNLMNKAGIRRVYIYCESKKQKNNISPHLNLDNIFKNTRHFFA